jgi:Family of unknown function (DUF5906)
METIRETGSAVNRLTAINWDDDPPGEDGGNPPASLAKPAPKLQDTPPQKPHDASPADHTWLYPYARDTMRARRGTKSGLKEGWPRHEGSKEEIDRIVQDGDNVAMITGRPDGVVVVDIDIPYPDLADFADKHALEILGPGVLRDRKGTGKRARIYKAPSSHVGIVRRRRMEGRTESNMAAWKAWEASPKGPSPKADACIELLGLGQQAIVFGIHPEGMPYRIHSCPTPDNLPIFDPEKWEPYIRKVADDLKRMANVTVVKDGLGGTLAGTGTVKRRGDEAPNPEVDPLAAMTWWKVNRPEAHAEYMGHNEFVDLCAAFRGAAGDHADELYEDFRELAPGGRDVDDNTEKTYHSFSSGERLGWSRLCAITGFVPPDAFAEPVSAAERAAMNAPDPDEVAHRKAINDALARSIYVGSQRRLYDTETGDFVDKEQFNDMHPDIAPVGSTGTKSAINQLLNQPSMRKVTTVTYRPDKADKLILHEEHNGAKVQVVNRYRKSSLVPVFDADVTPYLDHITTLFGPPGAPEREHFLNWMAHNVQKPGKKINHAIVLLGRHGIGKNTAFEPLLRAVGPHNYKAIKPEVLLGGFSHFLEAQLIIIEEMMNFEKRAVANKLKDWLAGTTSSRVEVNKKHQQPYSIPCIQNWIITTNHADAIALEETERRFWIHDCDKHEPRKDRLPALWEWFEKKGGIEACVGYLLKRDISKFSPHAEPPETAAKREMLRNAQPRQVRWLCEQFREDGALEGRTVLAVGDLKALAVRHTAPKDIEDKHAGAALRLEGFKKSQRGRINGRVRQLWTNNPEFDKSSWEVLKARYEKQVDCGGAGAEDKEGARA